MGHVRLGVLPRTKAWKEVVGLIAAGADVSQVANATINAAEKAFSFVMDDKGYTEAVWLMAQLALAASKDDPCAHLRSVGISLPDDATLSDVTVGISDALDRIVVPTRSAHFIGPFTINEPNRKRNATKAPT